MKDLSLQMPDWIILVAYFVVLLAIGVWASSKSKKGSNKFLAGHSLKWHHIGFSKSYKYHHLYQHPWL